MYLLQRVGSAYLQGHFQCFWAFSAERYEVSMFTSLFIRTGGGDPDVGMDVSLSFQP